MIELRSISKSYGAIRALADVSFRLEPGSVTGLLGRNGAGKSSLFKIMVGLIPADGGELLVHGQPRPFGDLSLRRRIGYVPESDLLDDYLTVREFLDFVAAIREVPAAERDADIERRLEFFELTDKRNALLIECSQGMRRKVSIAAALLGRPDFLLLDEAMNGLDPESRAALKQELASFCAAGGTVLFSTHVLETAEAVCDRALILVRGRIVRDLDAVSWGPGSGGGSLESQFLQAQEVDS